MARVLAGVGVMAGGVAVALTGQDCRVVGDFGTYMQSTFLGSINLTGRTPILSPDTCAMTDFTITGNVGFETLNRQASDYNVNELQRSITRHIEGGVSGEKFRKAGNLYGGVAMIAVGALIATVWSNVADEPLLDVALEPGRFQVGKTFGF